MKDATALERLKRAVIEKTGHYYYADKDKLLYERARERMQACGASSLEAYLELLDRADGGEWRALEDAITVGETYFFRYPDHFEALRQTILPDLIRRRAGTRTLRIWSIGCSNGAEPYSVAILLRELLGEETNQWRIALIGGDISEKALAAARVGRYSAWALRTMGPGDRQRYFDKNGAGWTLKDCYRSMVRFERQNLLALLSDTPPIEWSGFDLILCRNVLIYFSTQQAVAVAQALAKRVAPDGALLLGHVEATLAADPSLVDAVLPTEFAQALGPATPDYAPRLYTPPVVPPLPLSMWRPAEPVPAPRPGLDLMDELDRVRELADAGAYEEAQTRCQALMARDPMSARLQYYDAVLRQVSDDVSGAEAALRRALYLDRNFTLAHYRLGVLLLGLGRTTEARRSLLTAARLAQAAAPSDLLGEGQGASAGEFYGTVRALIDTLGAAA